VPSRLAEPSTARATVVLLLIGPSPEVALESASDHLGPDTQLVVVADDAPPDAADTLGRLARRDADRVEVLRTSAPLGPAAALNIGLRRSAGDVVVVLGPGIYPTGDLVRPLAAALENPGVAIAGADGLVGEDVRRLRPGPAGDVSAIDGRCLAFRRQLAQAKGPVDERLNTWPYVAAWWSLALRDEGDGRPPLRARALDNLPIAGSYRDPAAPEALARLVRRDRYRLLGRFGRRADLFGLPSGPSGPPPGPSGPPPGPDHP
jgi:glycosyltransferase involved in cell wall biosynthesis